MRALRFRSPQRYVSRGLNEGGRGLADPEDGGYQARLLDHVGLGEAGRRAGGGVAADIDGTANLHVQTAEHFLDAAIDEAPGTHVLRFLLAPDDVGVRGGGEDAGQ